MVCTQFWPRRQGILKAFQQAHLFSGQLKLEITDRGNDTGTRTNKPKYRRKYFL